MKDFSKLEHSVGGYSQTGTLSNKNYMEEFDYIVDARTPREYNHSHIPNAINLPVFSNAEYEKIGTIYKQESPLKANILGASIACKNISSLLSLIPEDKTLQSILNHKNKLLIYCARGGKRSEAMKTIFDHIGFRVNKLKNGYKGYRNEVLDFFAAPIKHSFITLCGPTGCGKSEIIQNLQPFSIDLENLAKHYGSSFGGMASHHIGTQPTQKMFENTLYAELNKRHNESILFIEAESRKMGSLIIPNTLFQTYHRGINILIQSHMQDRIHRIVELYKDIPEAEFLLGMQKIKPYIERKIFIELKECWERGELEKIAEILIEKYYDKVYKINTYSHKMMNINSYDTAMELLELKKTYEKSLRPR